MARQWFMRRFIGRVLFKLAFGRCAEAALKTSIACWLPIYRLVPGLKTKELVGAEESSSQINVVSTTYRATDDTQVPKKHYKSR